MWSVVSNDQCIKAGKNTKSCVKQTNKIVLAVLVLNQRKRMFSSVLCHCFSKPLDYMRQKHRNTNTMSVCKAQTKTAWFLKLDASISHLGLKGLPKFYNCCASSNHLGTVTLFHCKMHLHVLNSDSYKTWSL